MRKGLTGYEFTDLRVYYGAMNWWINDNESLYDYTIYLFGNELPFTYPPFAALLFSPFAAIGLASAYVIFTLAGLAAFGLALWWMLRGLISEQEWSPHFAFAVGLALMLALEPVWVTLAIGQINWLLLVLVLADGLALTRGSRWAGIGVGLAAAIKLTPAIFILYFLLTKRYRAALIACGTAIGATLLAAALAPQESIRFWTQALWDTERVGIASRIDNQSLGGLLARLTDSDNANKVLWLGVTLTVVAIGMWRARIAAQNGNELAGLTLTGLISGLASPISWIHHLLWVAPAIILFIGAALAGQKLYYLAAGATWALFASVAVFSMSHLDGFIGAVSDDAYVWGMLLILLLLPVGNYMPAMSLSTRSSTERNGSLQSTVR